MKDYDPCEGLAPTPEQVERAADVLEYALGNIPLNDRELSGAMRVLVDHSRPRSLVDTVFGPADHPDLPLGLRRHPRFALRTLIKTSEGAEAPSLYCHTEEDLKIYEALLTSSGRLGAYTAERWDDEKKAWVDL